MSDEEKKSKKTSKNVEVESSIPTKEKLTDFVIIGGKKKTIEKMKAGRYFKCQKVFLDMVSSVHSLNSQIEESRLELAEEKLKKAGKKEITFWNIMEIVPEKMMAFVAECLEVPVEFLENEASPEEIPEAYAKIVSLNNFMGNIKNFVAPIRESLGV